MNESLTLSLLMIFLNYELRQAVLFPILFSHKFTGTLFFTWFLKILYIFQELTCLKENLYHFCCSLINIVGIKEGQLNIRNYNIRYVNLCVIIKFKKISREVKYPNIKNIKKVFFLEKSTSKQPEEEGNAIKSPYLPTTCSLHNKNKVSATREFDHLPNLRQEFVYEHTHTYAFVGRRDCTQTHPPTHAQAARAPNKFRQTEEILFSFQVRSLLDLFLMYVELWMLARWAFLLY